MDLSGIQKFESRGGTVHSHYDGREIRRTFYLKPYRKAPDVVEAMLGSVTQQDDGGPWTRHFPAQDPDYPQCYCNEVKANLIDPRAIGGSETVAVNTMSIEPGPAYTTFMHRLNTVPDDPTGGTPPIRPCSGSFLTASYRPLISAYKPVYDRHELDGRIFDWINPHFAPQIRTVPWPDGLQVAAKPGLHLLTSTIPDEVANPISIPTIGFTVKRLLVGEVPWDLLNALTNTVNDASWPTLPERYTIPEFPKGTLRFDTFEVIEHYSPAASGALWFEIVLHFSWLSYRSTEVWDEFGISSGDEVGDVGWNHVLMTPVISAGDTWAPTLGWYFAVTVAQSKWTPVDIFSVQLGPVHPFANFDRLFMLNPPS